VGVDHRYGLRQASARLCSGGWRAETRGAPPNRHDRLFLGAVSRAPSILTPSNRNLLGRPPDLL
jgi:hypothetical protein